MSLLLLLLLFVCYLNGVVLNVSCQMADGKTYHAIEDAVDPISIAVKDINHRRQVHHDCWDRVYAFSTISRLTMLIMTSCALNPDLWGWGSSKG